jgi:hypothetical protein
MFKRGGFASYTKTGRRMQYGAAVGRMMAKGTSNSNSDSSENREEPGVCAYILFFVFVIMLLNGMTQCAKNNNPQ